jgi:hypothetical protein
MTETPLGGKGKVPEVRSIREIASVDGTLRIKFSRGKWNLSELTSLLRALDGLYEDAYWAIWEDSKDSRDAGLQPPKHAPSPRIMGLSQGSPLVIDLGPGAVTGLTEVLGLLMWVITNSEKVGSFNKLMRVGRREAEAHLIEAERHLQDLKTYGGTASAEVISPRAPRPESPTRAGPVDILSVDRYRKDSDDRYRKD